LYEKGKLIKMKMIKEWGYKPYPHWACKRCIVRPMCTESGCYMTEFFNSLCLSCEKNETCKEKCSSVQFSELCDTISCGRYKDLLIQNMLDQSVLYNLSKFDPREEITFQWWTE